MALRVLDKLAVAIFAGIFGFAIMNTTIADHRFGSVGKLASHTSPYSFHQFTTTVFLGVNA